MGNWGTVATSREAAQSPDTYEKRFQTHFNLLNLQKSLFDWLDCIGIGGSCAGRKKCVEAA